MQNDTTDQNDDQQNQQDQNQPTDNELNTLQEELMLTQQKLEEMTKISQRTLADLQNYKRRNEEEKKSFIEFANATMFKELLPGLENISRTLAHEPKDENWSKGAEQTMKQIIQICEKLGLKSIPTVGEKFNPNLHEALLTGPGEEDVILEELEKGYTLGDRVLKAARVKVGNGE
jgi:molecular chaperone GrpE